MQNLKDIFPTLPKDIKNFDFVAEFNGREGSLQDGFDCRVCKNKGHIEMRYKDNPDRTYLQECECMNRRKFIRTLKHKGLEDLLNYSVKGFKVTHDYQKEMKKLAIKYVEDDSRDWFCFLGQSGIGKTHLSSAIMVTLAKKNLNIEYAMWTTLIDDLKSCFKGDNNNAENDKKLLQTYKSAQILYIDDLFKGNNTEYVKGVAFDLINYRYVNNLTTILTSELSFEKLLEIDEATAGRIRERSKEYFIEVGKDPDKNYRITQDIEL